MATLSLARRDVCFDAKLALATSLSDWLDGRWGLVFSHPEDFAVLDLEADRWLTVIKDAFSAANVRALRVTTTHSRFASWIEQMNGVDPLLVLEPARSVNSAPSAGQVSKLRSAIARATSRFVMIVDESLNLRRTILYTLADARPSLLDFAASVAKLQTKPRPQPERESTAVLARVLPMPGRLRSGTAYA